MSKQNNIIYLDDDTFMQSFFEVCFQEKFNVKTCATAAETRAAIAAGASPNLLVIDINLPGESGTEFLKSLKADPKLASLPVLMLSGDNRSSTRVAALKAGADDFLVKPFNPEELELKMERLVQKGSSTVTQAPRKTPPNGKGKKWPGMPWSKRLFDIVASSSLLLLLLPVLLLVALLIKLDSRGPVFYASKRVGQSYRVFNFYKFRSMRTDADKLLDSLKQQNQYAQALTESVEEVCGHCRKHNEPMLLMDGKQVCEHYVENLAKTESSFLKIQNDPRVTRLGAFLRNSSLDELPQLFNVLLGDMSLVGNRPLPLYEAEKLTRDAAVKRFAAPAGITGLWQVSKRGRSEMSEDERIALDNMYADICSLRTDLRLILKTVPALLQKESV